MTNYTPEDYKKYVYAEGLEYLCRIQENIKGIDDILGFDIDDTEDLNSMLGNAMGFLWAAAFANDEDQGHRREDARVPIRS